MKLTKEEALKEIEKLSKSLEELKRYVEQVDNKGPWKPEKEDEYYVVEGNGNIRRWTWMDHSVDHDYLSMGNVFKTREEAEKHKLRLQAMAVKWLPEEYQAYYTVDLDDGALDCDTWTNHPYDWTSYWMGNTHRTKEDAQAWKDKYLEAFKIK